jgi:hypothetical protein
MIFFLLRVLQVLGHRQGLGFAYFCIKKMPVEGYAMVDFITSSELIFFLNHNDNKWSQIICWFKFCNLLCLPEYKMSAYKVSPPSQSSVFRKIPMQNIFNSCVMIRWLSIILMMNWEKVLVCVWVNLIYSCIQEFMFPVQVQWGHSVNDAFLFYIMHVMKAYRASSEIAPLIIKLGTKWRWILYILSYSKYIT